MLVMFIRRLTLPPRPFLLLGPRGTGKTTWLRRHLPRAQWYNLLLDRELLRLMREPGAFRREIEALPKGAWVVIDEVQKLPSLLNEVHDALTAEPKRWNFALSGSSARRLRRAEVNLLGGRVVMRQMLPLTAGEIGRETEIAESLRFGGLPLVCAEKRAAGRIDLLEAYVETYLTQEIRAEALVRSLEGFTRFLEVAALAKRVNVACCARVANPPAGLFRGPYRHLWTWLPAGARAQGEGYDPAPLDCGVARRRASAARAADAAERGTFGSVHELRAQMARAIGGERYIARRPTEIDFIWTARADRHEERASVGARVMSQQLHASGAIRRGWRHSVTG